jgi:pyruvate dehydrogenase E1 component alpha subunit
MNIVRNIEIKSSDLIEFEERVYSYYNNGDIKGPIHLSNGNEEQLIDIFKYIDKDDWVFSAWRNHYHALLHGVNPDVLFNWICDGKSMSFSSKTPKFYSSSIVSGTIPIALGSAIALKRTNSKNKVWCFIGDMTVETGIFWEAYKYSMNFELPIKFVVEDNGISVTTPTEFAWGKKMEKLDGVIYYEYKSKYPHHGTGKWVNF